MLHAHARIKQLYCIFMAVRRIKRSAELFHDHPLIPVYIFHFISLCAVDAGNRGVAHRRRLYHKLIPFGDVITFDYRGFGDSDGFPTGKFSLFDNISNYSSSSH